MSSIEIPRRINNYSNSIKIIVILRNPYERLKSAYYHMIRDGFLPVLPLNCGMEKILNNEISNEYPRAEELLKFSLYSRYIEKYKQIFNDRLLILYYEDLNNNPNKVIKDCYNFLGVNDNLCQQYAKVYKEKRAQKTTHSLVRLRFEWLKNQYQYEYNSDRTRLYKRDKNILEKIFVKLITTLDIYILKYITPSGKKPDFGKTVKTKLDRLLIKDIGKLEKLLSTNLKGWKA